MKKIRPCLQRPSFSLLLPPLTMLLLLLAMPALAASLNLSLALDKQSYAPGETVMVTVNAKLDRTPVSRPTEARVQIFDSAGLSIFEAALVEKSRGVFTAQGVLPANAFPGNWRAEARMTYRRVNGSTETSFSVAAPVAVDSDGDGVVDGVDQCPGTPVGTAVDAVGCPKPVTPPPPSDGHYGDKCLDCHAKEANEVHGSLHYQWQGDAPDMVNGPSPQGKLTNSVNSYCINILGNWQGCGACHIGKGAKPEAVASQAQLENIDCLKCHSKGGVLPTRVDCLKCHAKAGGGDAVKRGDLALAQGNTSDRVYDVHMATTGANLNCQSCHITQAHRIAGKGSDLRATDLAVQMSCTDCHAAKATSSGHSSADIGRHVGRVACQTCHIPIYAKDAADTLATEATETHRTWVKSDAVAAPFHPSSVKANNLVPKYRFWNGKSNNYLLGDLSKVDPATGRIPTSRPVGGVNDAQSKLYPFKYKTAEQPMIASTKQLIALDTSVYFATADPVAATRKGLVNMGFSADEPYSWVVTDTFQLLNHQVSPQSSVLGCNDCHGSTTRINLKGELGYGLKGATATVCTQCHGLKEVKPFTTIHDKHVKDKGYDCSWCHSFSRPERGLRKP